MLDSPVMADREELDENTKLLYVGLFRLRRQKHAVFMKLASDKSRSCANAVVDQTGERLIW